MIVAMYSTYRIVSNIGFFRWARLPHPILLNESIPKWALALGVQIFTFGGVMAALATPGENEESMTELHLIIMGSILICMGLGTGLVIIAGKRPTR